MKRRARAGRRTRAAHLGGRVGAVLLVTLVASVAAAVPARAQPTAAAPSSAGVAEVEAPAAVQLAPVVRDLASSSPRARYVTLDAPALAADLGDGWADLALFGDVVVPLVGAGGPVAGAGDTTTWAGTTPGGGYATFTFRGPDLYADLTVDGVRYDVQPVADGTHLVTVEARDFPDETEPEGHDHEGHEPSAPGPPDVAAPAGGEPQAATVRVLTVYDTQARTWFGGDAAAQAAMAATINETNAAYARSGVTTTLESAGIEYVDYERAGISSLTKLTELAGTSDAYLNAVHGRRDQVGADLVSLVSVLADTCGIAYLPSTPNAASGFSVADSWCATQNYTYAHELGHNMGAGHGYGDQGRSSYSNGYRDIVRGFRTIMAYDDGVNCPFQVSGPNQFRSCPRVGHFSSATVTYNGWATGSATQDNARTLNDTQAAVAAYRGAPQLPGAPRNVSAAAGNTQATVSWLAPTSPGGSPITAYTVTSSPGNRTCVTAGALSCVVTGLTNGVSYTFTVRATNAGGQGPASAASAPVTPQGPPANDDFAAATAATLPVAVVGTTALATSQVGEPVHAGVAGSTSVWWRFTAPADGTVSASTKGSWVDTLLAAYTGSAVGSLVAVGSNDDDPAGGSTSRVSFPVVAGISYSVAVAGKGGAGGPVALSVTLDAPDGQFNGIAPTRVLDSRFGTGGHTTPWPAATTRNVAVVGGATGVPVTATAVVLNVTGVGPTHGTHLTVFPAGEPAPLASNLNLPAGGVRPNLVTVAVGAGGAVSIFNNSGSVHVVADVVGYFGPIAGSTFAGLAPKRLLDSRDGTGGHATPWPAATSRSVVVRGGSTTVPADATAVVLNVTVTGPSQASHLTVSPAGEGTPLASNLNFGPGETVPNLVVVEVGTGGAVSIFNNAGSVHVLADVVGYFRPTGGAAFTGVTPSRALDSRDGTGGVPGAWGPGTVQSFPVTGGTTGVPTDATAVVLNVTGVFPTQGTHLTVFGAGTDPPLASTLNLPPGDVRPNLVVVDVGDLDRVSIFNNAGTVHVLADVVGYFR